MKSSRSPGHASARSCPSLEAVELLERLPTERVQAQMELEQDVLLALEVVVERGLGRAEPLGDVAQRGLVVALLGEQLECDVEDALARGGPGLAVVVWRGVGTSVWSTPVWGAPV